MTQPVTHGEVGEAWDAAPLFRQLVDTSPSALLVVDASGHIRLCNRRAEELFGLTADALRQRDVDRVLPSFWQACHESLSNEASRQAPSSRGHIAPALRSDGQRFCAELHMASLRAGQGYGTAIVCHITDITERMATEEALRRSEASFRALIEETPEGVAVQREGRLVYVNAALLAMLGYAGTEELLGRSLLELVHADERHDLLDRARPTLRPGAPDPWECRFVHREGTVIVVEVVALRIVFGGLPAVVLLVRDVTERKRLQAQLVVSDRMATVGTLAAGVAHEINNPLAFIVANLAFLHEQLSENPAGAGTDGIAEVLEEVAAGVERIRDIVRDLKTFSRVEPDESTRVDVHAVLDSAIGMASNEIRHRGTLVKHYAPDLPAARGDAHRLCQVFLNILINAAQAIEDGQAMLNEIRVSTYRMSGERIGIEVRDTGRGIAASHIDRIFEPFFTTKPQGQGTGLGLSICHAIVTKLGGEIRVSSDASHGTRFAVTLPAAATAEEAMPPAHSPEPRTSLIRRRARLLVIDDDALVLRALERALRRYQLVTFASGCDAVDHLAQDQDFDIILCDLMMPDISGMDVYERVQRSWPGLERRIVFMTGGAFSERARRFIDGIPNARVDKPFDVVQMQALLQGIIETSSSPILTRRNAC